MCLLLAACAGDAPDTYFDEATPDDGNFVEPLVAGAKRVAVVPGETKNAELVDTLPVGRTESGAERRVVMKLSPAELPNLAAGDRLITPAEAEVTTRCDVGQVAPGCNYNPSIRAKIVLTDGTHETAIGNDQTQSCTHDEHHCTFVFRPGDTQLVLDPGIPCLNNGDCRVELVMWAWDPAARSGGVDKVLVGQNDGDYLQNGKVDGDSGRLMAVRERGITAADRAKRETTDHGDMSINLNANPEIVYSHAVEKGDLAAGEQFVVEAKVTATMNGRARLSTELVLTRDRNGSENTIDGVTPTAIGEGNGQNCTNETCTAHKVAVFKADRAIQGPVYVNLIVQSAVPGGAPARVTVHRGDGFVRSVRYSAKFQ
jgi:hypothetical protein